MISEIRMAATPAANAASPDARAPATGEFDDVLRQALPDEPQAPRTPDDAARPGDAAPPAKPARAADAGAGAAADGAGTASDATGSDREDAGAPAVLAGG